MKLLRIGAIGLALLGVGAGTATSLMHVRLKLEMLELGYLLGREARMERELTSAKERLRVELALLKSPARIGQQARGELGLVPAEPTQVHRVDPADPGATARQRAAVREKADEARALASIRSRPAARPAKSGKPGSGKTASKPASKPTNRTASKPGPTGPRADLAPLPGQNVARASSGAGRATP